MVLHESGEDYLEAILVLRQEKGIVLSLIHISEPTRH